MVSCCTILLNLKPFTFCTTEIFFATYWALNPCSCIMYFLNSDHSLTYCSYQLKTIDSMHLPLGCCMVWFYFGNNHGKGVHDRAGAVLKQEVRKEQLTMDSQHLQNTINIVTFYKRKQTKDHEAYLNVKRDINCYFHLVRLENMDQITS
jgi:hypothetical protein